MARDVLGVSAMRDPSRNDGNTVGLNPWIAWAADLADRAARHTDGPSIPRMAGRVVLVAATTVAFRTTIAWMLEDQGATVILADTAATAGTMLGHFDVDAVVLGIESEDETLCGIPQLAREIRARPPLALALVDPHIAGCAGMGGFDAVVPFASGERDALLGLMVRALDRRDPVRHGEDA